MSVVTGVIKDNMAAIACDSQYSRGSLKIYEKYKVDKSKIYNLNDNWIGVTGWYAVELAFIHALKSNPEIVNLSSREAIYETLLQIQPVLEKDYFMETHEDSEQPVDSNQVTALIINKNGLFDIGSYREVNQFSRFWALGSGQRLALGAMHALYERDADAKTIAEAGALAATEFNDGCSAPVRVESFDL